MCTRSAGLGRPSDTQGKDKFEKELSLGDLRISTLCTQYSIALTPLADQVAITQQASQQRTFAPLEIGLFAVISSSHAFGEFDHAPTPYFLQNMWEARVITSCPTHLLLMGISKHVIALVLYQFHFKEKIFCVK